MPRLQHKHQAGLTGRIARTRHMSKDAVPNDDAVWGILDTFRDLDLGKTSGVSDETTKCIDWCPTCKRDEIVLDEGNYVCKSCGNILARFIDHGAEWRYYGNDDSKGNDPTRCGLPTSELLPDSSLGSVIGYAKTETHEIRVMRKYHMWNSMSYKERSLYNVFDVLTVSAVNNGLNKSIIDEAKMLYKRISEMQISRGENRNGLIASSIYMSCKRNRVPRSAKEIAKIFNLKTTTMTKGCKKFQDLLQMKMESTNAEDFIGRFCSKLNLTEEMRNICRQVVQQAEEYGVVSENTPPSIAAGSIYLCNTVLGWGISKKELGEACEISQVTISKCFKKLEMYKDLVMKDVHLPKDKLK